ncbi:WD40 repeat-like protein [Saitoella complicata NRRL Y-17804]|uniref:Uncharacterized protein n=1 Tax=Saitoella complicata (strain BCRC 22490 / CBS 7301 / JCM 7358 / NBRC 10748 / NRRL Y-17804) TaxID=698492 RepID=A0A0E9NA80_SAICN|nr:WD40 repeat-like protein [Saitoella complicata NRRL Y-17804]ODQ53180.1 WD40 repeat-like protein [Saitoella complicata NRRL Y-17804]GAO46310.1 hypothetical protein G7K_0542-t1 [Saitoella complicata NRRL Y-17804]
MDKSGASDERTTITLDGAPKLLARGVLSAGATDERNGHSRNRSATFFKSVQWSPDGSTLLSVIENNHLQSWIVPPDILEPTNLTTRTLSPYTTTRSAESIHAALFYPFYSLQNPSTCLYLASSRDHPIHLHNSLTDQVVGSYPNINHVERFLAANSMCFAPDGAHFVVGTMERIAVFDVHRLGTGPMSVIPTVRKFDSMSQQGVISALAIAPSSPSLLAAGSYSRTVGLYDISAPPRSSCVAVYPVESKSGGVTQVVWSTCGRYLYVVSRRSDGIEVWDIRGTGEVLGSLRGRNAFTNQRISIDISPDGRSLLSGSVDGKMREWNAVIDGSELSGEPVRVWDAASAGTTVASATYNPVYPKMVATCTGQRSEIDLEDSESDSDSGVDSEQEFRKPRLRRQDVESQLDLWLCG